MAKKERRYEFIGTIDIEGRRMNMLVHTDCRKCYGRGYLGKNTNTNSLVGCVCVLTVALPIMWLVLQ